MAGTRRAVPGCSELAHRLHRGLSMTHIDADAIRTLRREALEHADFAQAAVCELALTGEIDCSEHIQLSERESARIGSMSAEQAREACARAISAARAQE